MTLLYLAQAKDLGSIDVAGTTKFSVADPTAINTIFSQVIGFLTIVAGLAFLIYFIIGAINWITAGGDAKKVDTAKSYMTNGAIGMVVIVAAYSIIWIIGQVLGLNILDPGDTFSKITNGQPSSVQPTTSTPSNQNITKPGARPLHIAE